MTTQSLSTSSRSARAALALMVAGSVSGCFSEDLQIFDLEGTMVIPRDAGIINGILDPATGVEAVDPQPDIRALGPAYVGLYASVRNDIGESPLPETGPSLARIDEQTFFQSHPYGGTTVGDIRFGCYQALRCKMISGRYTDFDDIVDWFANYLGTPVTDSLNREITTGDAIRQSCYEILRVTQDEEIRITATEDRNEDGEIDEGDLDFVVDGNGDFVAQFIIREADYFEGMTAWGFMDAPSGLGFDFATCDQERGFNDTNYNANYQAGVQQVNVLNIPDAYLDAGDYVARHGFVWDDPYAAAELVLDFKVGRDDVADIVIPESAE